MTPPVDWGLLLFLEKKGRTTEAKQVLESVAKTNKKLELLEGINVRFRKTNEQNELFVMNPPVVKFGVVEVEE